MVVGIWKWVYEGVLLSPINIRLVYSDDRGLYYPLYSGDMFFHCGNPSQPTSVKEHQRLLNIAQIIILKREHTWLAMR